MKQIIILTLLIFTTACFGQSKQPSNAQLAPNENWEQVGIYELNGGEVEDSIREKLEQLQVSVRGDTMIINQQYKARFDKEEMPTDQFFGNRMTQFSEDFYLKFFGNRGIDITKKIRFLDFYSYKDYFECGFPYMSYFEPGSGFVYEPPYLFLAYKWYRVCYKQPEDNQHPTNSADKTSIYTPYINASGNYTPISLPFSTTAYSYDTGHGEGLKYRLYSLTENFQKYLIDKGYEATEDYRCFIIPSKEDLVVLLVWIIRGDNEYAVVVTANSDKIISCFEASDMTQNIVIDKNLLISQYLWNDQSKCVGSYKIQDDGLIVKSQ